MSYKGHRIFMKSFDKIIAIILTIFIFTYKMDKFNQIINMCLIAIGACIFIKSSIKVIGAKKLILNKYYVIWYLSTSGMILSFLNSADKRASIKYIIFYFIFISISLYFSNRKYMVEAFIKTSKVMSLIFAIFTFLPLISEGLYISIINNFFKLDTINSIEYFLMQNRYTGLGAFSGNNAFLLTIGFAIFFSELIINKKNIILNLFLMVFIFIAIMLTSSRIMMLSTVLSSIVCYLWKDKNRVDKLFKKIALTSLLMLMILIIILIISPDLVQNVIQRFLYGTESISSRFVLYQYAIMLFESRFLFGYGINTFLGLTYLNVHMHENTYVHNVILQLLAETGIVGTIIIIIPYVKSWIRTWKKLKLENNKVLLISFFIQNIILMYFFTGNPLYDFNILLCYFICIAVVPKN